MNGDLGNPSRKENKKFVDQLTRLEFILAISLITVTVYLLYCKLNTREFELPECGDIAYYESTLEIENSIDPSVDPCEDFNEFVCGNFFKKQTSPRIVEELEAFDCEMDGTIFEPISKKDTQQVVIQKMFFRACMDTKEMDSNQDSRIFDLIEQIGGWPMTKENSWSNNNYDWVQTMIKCKKLGLPFQWFLELDLHVEDVNYLKISYPKFAKQHNNASKIMKNVMVTAAGKNKNTKEVFNFHKKLMDLISKQKSTLSLITIGELEAKHPLFDWLDPLNMLLDGVYVLTNETTIASNVEEYFLQLYQLLKGTSKRTQADYITWKILEYFAPYMSYQMRQQVVQQKRLEFCNEETKKKFLYFSEIHYARKYSNEKIVSKAREITTAVHDEFLNRIENTVEWNTTARQIYLDKFKQMTIEIGTPDEFFDEDFLESNYWHLGDLIFDGETPNIIEIITRTDKCYYDSLFSNINKTGVDLEEKNLILESLKPKIYIYFDKIILPSSILHGLFFDLDRPRYLNFASLGTLLAKELIMTLRTLTESDGNVTFVAFDASIKCLEHDQKNLLTEKSNFSSFDLVHETVPDIIAFDIAYTAYQNWVATNGDESQLPLFSYNPNQLFWIKSSLINCRKKMTDFTDQPDFDLTVSKYKNVLSARHSRFFAADFRCDEKTPMNPDEKC